MTIDRLDDEKLKALGRAVIETEARAVSALLERIDDAFTRACRHMLQCRGRIVVTGMGKSGHVGGKIAATLASTGTPAFFVHPGEASHGDLGMITAGDVVLAISNSGETQELLTILPLIKRLEVPLIAMTGNPRSTLARGVDIRTTPIARVMTRDFKAARKEWLAAEALSLMETHKINALPVVDDDHRVIGVFNMHDLLRAGVV